MINQNLHRQPTALDSAQHRTLRIATPVADWSVADKLNAIFVAATEFGDACRDFPILFVRAGKEDDGSDAIAPIAVLGLVAGENLFVDDKAWRGRYMPAILRMYPFCIGRIDDTRFAICVDTGWSGAAAGGEGQALFDGDGKASAFLQSAQKELEVLEGEIQRTRALGRKLVELDVLREMRFDATLPDGRTHTVDGFLTVDEDKVTQLPDAVVGELHRSGVLGLMHLHWVSLANMRRLLDWHVARHGIAAAPQAAAAASDAAAAPSA